MLPRSRVRLALLVLLVACAQVLPACGADDDHDAAAGTASNDETELEGSISVFAASSLTEAFTALAEEFEGEHPGVSIRDDLNFAASSDLVGQITEGAPADVFASADEPNMQKIVDADAASGTPVVFAHNRLAIAVEPGNPRGIEALADLANPDVKVVLCAETVPCGRFADAALRKAGVTVSPVSREVNVKDTLGKVGEADAAIVYATDVASSDEVDGIEIPDDQNVIATLPIVTLKEAGNSELADAWVEYVTSPDAQRILIDQFGFVAA